MLKFKAYCVPLVSHEIAVLNAEILQKVNNFEMVHFVWVSLKEYFDDNIFVDFGLSNNQLYCRKILFILTRELHLFVGHLLFNRNTQRNQTFFRL